MSAEDRTYLIQQVGAATGIAAADSQRRVDSVIGNAKTAIARSRRSTIILAFSLATALLIGAVAAWGQPLLQVVGTATEHPYLFGCHQGTSPFASSAQFLNQQNLEATIADKFNPSRRLSLLFPHIVREAIKDTVAEAGITEEDLVRWCESPCPRLAS